jgi:imidazolonepropionase-like amidohydrolase
VSGEHQMKMAPTTFTLTGGTVLGEDGQIIQGGSVRISGNVITDVSERADVGLSDGEISFDVNGLTVMPGLIDGHVHLLSNAGAEVSDVHLWNVTTFVEEQTLHAARNAVIALECGVTTVRDMAGSRPEIAVSHAVRDGVIPGARVITSGFVGMTAGHGDMFCPPAIKQRLWTTADGEDSCRRLVREYVRDGVDWIKICTSGGVLSQGDDPAWRNFTDGEVRAVVDEAHALGRRVAAHAHTETGIRQAVTAGVDTIEHGTELTDELAAEMAAADIALCPTLALSDYLQHHGKERGVPSASLAKAAQMTTKRIASLRSAHAAGVRIFMGTDSCNAMRFGNHAQELVLMQAALQASNLEVLSMATQGGADALGLGNHTGSLRPGKWADVLLVRGNPAEDLSVLTHRQNIAAVLVAGRIQMGGAELDRRMSQPTAHASSA